MPDQRAARGLTEIADKLSDAGEDGCWFCITLLAPPPLGQQLVVVVSDRGMELRKGETTLATGRSARIEVPEISSVKFGEAVSGGPKP